MRWITCIHTTSTGLKSYFLSKLILHRYPLWIRFILLILIGNYVYGYDLHNISIISIIYKGLTILDSTWYWPKTELFIGVPNWKWEKFGSLVLLFSMASKWKRCNFIKRNIITIINILCSVYEHLIEKK